MEFEDEINEEALVQENEEQVEDEDDFETALDIRTHTTWSSGGTIKSKTIREIIKCFGSMVKSFPKEYAIPDKQGRFRQEDLMYEKLMDASKYVVRAKNALLQHENFDTREFTIFIANKKWAKNIIRPLLELCEEDDSILAMRCCGLVLVLIKRLSDKAIEALKSEKKKRKPAKKGGEEALGFSENEQEDEGKTKALINNAHLQLNALISFKQALCSEKCNQAICRAFLIFWTMEQNETNEDNKQGAAICISYIRRILAIEADPQWCNTSTSISLQQIHDKYIVQLRQFIAVIPSICSDLLRAYHNDWLSDIILILHYCFRSFEPQEIYYMWKTGALPSRTHSVDPTPSTYEPSEPLSPETEKENRLNKPAALPSSQLIAEKARRLVTTKGSLSSQLQKERMMRTVGGSSFSSNRALPTKQPMKRARMNGTFSISLQQPTSALPTKLEPIAIPQNLPPPKAKTPYDKDANPYPNLNPYDSSRLNKEGTSPTPAQTVQVQEVNKKEEHKVAPQLSILLRDPFAGAADSMPQAQSRRAKQQMTFSMDNSFVDHGLLASRNAIQAARYSSVGGDSEGACLVVASLMKGLSDEVALKAFVRRVNEDLRRDEMRVGPELELCYFNVMARVLQCNRLLLEDEYRGQKEMSLEKGLPLVWEPRLKNVIDALDRMSFMRVVVAIERVLKKKPPVLEDLIAPMSLFKEMVCYLRVMLTSSAEGHHEIAVAAMYRVYYISQEKLDPLPKLLKDWKPGKYSKKHLDILIELCHETMKTLDLAEKVFKRNSSIDWTDKVRTKAYLKKKKKDMDLEQYVLSCCAFSSHEYFKRLVTNESVKMYVRLLSDCTRNDSHVNHYLLTFLTRVASFRLLDDDDVDVKVDVKPSFMTIEHPSLGFMLFNVQNLLIFDQILSDPMVVQMQKTNPIFKRIISFIQRVVRVFFQLAEKNQLLYVEALFNPPRAHDHCKSLHSVYYATQFRPVGSKGLKERIREGLNGLLGGEGEGENTQVPEADNESEEQEQDYGDEFDENDVSAAFRSVPKLKKKPSKKPKKRVYKGTDFSDGELSEGDLEVAQQNVKDLPKFRSSRGLTWSKEEDKVLAEQYKLFAGKSTVFTDIVNSSPMKAFEKTKSAIQVEKRVRELRLHLAATQDDDDDDDIFFSDSDNSENPISKIQNPTKTPLTDSPSLHDENNDETGSPMDTTESPEVEDPLNMPNTGTQYSTATVETGVALVSPVTSPPVVRNEMKVNPVSSVKEKLSSEKKGKSSQQKRKRVEKDPALDLLLSEEVELDEFDRRSMGLVLKAQNAGISTFSTSGRKEMSGKSGSQKLRKLHSLKKGGKKSGETGGLKGKGDSSDDDGFFDDRVEDSRKKPVSSRIESDEEL